MKTEYEIIEAKGARALVSALNAATQWEPIGGPAVAAGMFYQLVRRKPEVPSPKREEA